MKFAIVLSKCLSSRSNLRAILGFSFSALFLGSTLGVSLAQAGILSSRPPKLDTSACAQSLSIELSQFRVFENNEAGPVTQEVRELIQGLGQKARQIEFALSRVNKGEGLCHYVSVEEANSESLPGVLYMRGTREFPVLAFTGGLNVSGTLSFEIAANLPGEGPGAGTGGSTLDQGTATLIVELEGEYPLKAGSARFRQR